MIRWVAVGSVAVGLGALMLWLAAGPAHAVAPSPETGGEISARWCAGCHVVSASGAGNERAPSFPVLSGMRSRDQIVAALRGSHSQPMRGFTLSQREAEDIAAYIVSLKDEQQAAQ